MGSWIEGFEKIYENRLFGRSGLSCLASATFQLPLWGYKQQEKVLIIVP